MVKVYYNAKANEDGSTLITLTEAAYFKKKDSLDLYGDSENADDIAAAILDCGATAVGVSYDDECVLGYNIPAGTTIANVIDDMASAGFDLVKDKAFDKYCDDYNTVYYSSGTGYGCFGDDKVTIIVATSKAYWDIHGCLDDGTSVSGLICMAICECGCSESMESEFEVDDGVTVSDVVDGMRKLGFTMVENTDFSDFLDECDEDDEDE